MAIRKKKTTSSSKPVTPNAKKLAEREWKRQIEDRELKIATAFDAFKRGVDGHLQFLAAKDVRGFRDFVFSFGDKTCHQGFWESVFNFSIGTDLFNILYIRSDTVTTFKRVLENIDTPRRLVAIESLIRATMECNDVPSDTDQTIHTWVRAQVVKLLDTPEVKFRNLTAATEYVLAYSQPSSLTEWKRQGLFFKHFNISDQYVISAVTARVKREMRAGKFKQWFTQGVDGLIDQSTCEALFQAAMESPELSLTELTRAAGDLKLKLSAEQKTKMTERLFQKTVKCHSSDVVHYYRERPDCYDREMVRAKLLERIQQEISPDPKEMVEAMLDGKPYHRMRGFPFHPIMMMELPRWGR